MPQPATAQAQKKSGPAAKPPESAVPVQPAHPAARGLLGGNQANQAALRQYMDEQKGGPEVDAQLRKSVDVIAYQLKTQKWTSRSNRDFIIREVQYWCRRDDQHREATGQEGTPYLDRLLRMLKSRTVNMGDFLADRHMLLYDALWHLLEHDEKGEYKALVKRSRTEGIPPVGPGDTGLQGLGKSLAVSGLGFVQGASKGLAGVADAATWVASVVTGNENLKTDLAGKVGKQYNDLGKELLGEYWTDGAKVLFGMNAAEMSSGVGNVAITIALSGSGNVTWLKNANGLKSITVVNNVLSKAGSLGYGLTNLKGAGVSIENVFKVALRLNDEAYAEGRELTARELVSNGEFFMELCNAVSNTFGAIAGVPTKSFQTELWKFLGIYMDGLAAFGMVTRLWEIVRSDMSQEQKLKAAGPLLLEFAAKIGTMVLGKVNYDKEFGKKYTIPDVPRVAPEPKVKQPRVDRRKQNRLKRRAGQLAEANQRAAAREQAARGRQEARAVQQAEAARTSAEVEANTKLAAEAEAEMRAQAPTLPAQPQPLARKYWRAEQQRWYNAQSDPSDPRHALLKDGLKLDEGKALARAGITPADFASLGIRNHADAALLASLVQKGLQPVGLKYLLQQGVTLKDIESAKLSAADLPAAMRLYDNLAGRLDAEGLTRAGQHGGDLTPHAYLLSVARFERSGTPQYGDLEPILTKYGITKPEERALLRAAAQSGTLSVGERAALDEVMAHIMKRLEATKASPAIRQAVQAYGKQADLLRLAYMDDMMKARTATNNRMPIPEEFAKRIERILKRNGVEAAGDVAAFNTLPFEFLPAQHQQAAMQVREFWETQMRRDVADSNGALMHKEVPPGNVPGMLNKGSRYNNAMLSGYWTWDPAVKLMDSPEAAFHQMALGYMNTGFSPAAGERFFMVAHIGQRLSEDFHVPMGPAAAASADGIEHIGKGIGTYPSALNGMLAARNGLLPEWTWTGASSQRLPNGTRLYRQAKGGTVELFAVVKEGRWETVPPKARQAVTAGVRLP